MIPSFSPCGAAVDLLRSCYTTTMRLFRDRPDVESKVRWFFTAPGVKPLAFPTAFASLNWVDLQKEPSPTLGEIPGADRDWSDGQPPPVALVGQPCGSADQFLVGDLAPPDPPIVPVAWGVPPCCVAPSDGPCLLLWQMGISAPPVMFGLSVLTWATISGDVGLIDLAAGCILGAERTVVRKYRPASSLPNWTLAYNTKQAIVAVTGTLNDPQLLAQALSSLIGPVPQGGFAVSSYSASAGSVVQMELYAAGLPFDIPLTLVGHSMGVSVCDYVAAREIQLRPSRVTRELGLGGPRSGDADLGSILTTGVKIRVEREGDVVPFIPPDLTAFTWILNLVSQAVAVRWSRFRPNGRGLQLFAEGRIDPADPQGAGVTDVLSILQQWLTSATLDIEEEHGLPAYTFALSNAVELSHTQPDPRCLDYPSLVLLANQLAHKGIATDAEGALVAGGLAFAGEIPQGAVVCAGQAYTSAIAQGGVVCGGEVFVGTVCRGAVVIAGEAPFD